MATREDSVRVHRAGSRGHRGEVVVPGGVGLIINKAIGGAKRQWQEERVHAQSTKTRESERKRGGVREIS